MEFDVKWVNDWMEKALKKSFSPTGCFLLFHVLVLFVMRFHALQIKIHFSSSETMMMVKWWQWCWWCMIWWWFWFELQSQISVPLVRRVDRGRESMRRTTRSAILCFHLTSGEFPGTPKNDSFYATVMFGFWLTGSSMVIDSFRFIQKRCKSTLIS